MLYFAAVLLALTALLDGISTVHFLRKGLAEQNPIFGPRPSYLKLFGLGSVIIAAEVGATFLLYKLAHAAGYVAAAGTLAQAAYHCICARRNFKL